MLRKIIYYHPLPELLQLKSKFYCYSSFNFWHWDSCIEHLKRQCGTMIFYFFFILLRLEIILWLKYTNKLYSTSVVKEVEYNNLRFIGKKYSLKHSIITHSASLRRFSAIVIMLNRNFQIFCQELFM